MSAQTVRAIYAEIASYIEESNGMPFRAWPLTHNPRRARLRMLSHLRWYAMLWITLPLSPGASLFHDGWRGALEILVPDDPERWAKFIRTVVQLRERRLERGIDNPYPYYVKEVRRYVQQNRGDVYLPFVRGQSSKGDGAGA